jgi:hypothetical protein
MVLFPSCLYNWMTEESPCRLKVANYLPSRWLLITKKKDPPQITACQDSPRSKRKSEESTFAYKFIAFTAAHESSAV